MAEISIGDVSWRVHGDEQVGGNLVDDIGSVVGVATGSPILDLVTPILGAGTPVFDAADDRYDFGNAAAGNMGTDHFVLSFILDAIGGAGEGWAFNKRTANGWYAFITSTGKLKFAINAAGEKGAVTTTTTVRNGGEFAVYIECHRTRGNKILLNGVQNGPTSAPPGAGNIDNTVSLMLGSKNTGSSRYAGRLDEITAYKGYTSDDDAETVANAVKLYNSGAYLVLGEEEDGGLPRRGTVKGVASGIVRGI